MGISIFRCDRCAEYFTGDSYRVTSEADGVLDMIVCYGCCLRASELGLDTEAIEVRRYAAR
jgi:ribosomal protein L37AE/L43A